MTQCHAFDPEVVVVTGGVMRAADVILPALRERVHADLWSSSFRPPFVTPDDPSTSVLRGLAALAARSRQQRTAMTTVDSRDVPLEDYMLDDRSSYVKLPTVPLPDGSEVLVGDDAWRPRWRSPRRATGHPLVAVDVYPGGDVAAIAARIREVLPEAEVIDVEDAAAADLEVIDALITRNLTDDRVFGVMSHFTVDEFYDAERLAALRRRVAGAHRPDGARRLGRRPRGRSAARTRSCSSTSRGGRSSSGSGRAPRTGEPTTATEDVLRKYKRGFFVEWRTADRHKRTLFDRIDLLVDGNAALDAAGAVRGADFRRALADATARPVPRRPVLRPRRLGRAVDEEHARPRPDR